MTFLPLIAICISLGANAAIPKSPSQKTLTTHERLQAKINSSASSTSASVIFDLPVTYNHRVRYWIDFFQNKSSWFSNWLEKSSRYMPMIQRELKNHGMPQDLAYMVMIESGFEANAQSHASAVGPWQFIQSTGERHGLKISWWLDERRDLKKSTLAAIRYMRSLYAEFGSWYLVAASYNMGENGLRRQIQKYKTKDFWTLSRLGALPQETMDYVPKILAAMMIAKSPMLYGFKDLVAYQPLDYDIVFVPGGIDLSELADQLAVTRKSLKDLNAEILLGYIPRQIEKHAIRVPKGSAPTVGKILGQKIARK